MLGKFHTIKEVSHSFDQYLSAISDMDGCCWTETPCTLCVNISSSKIKQQNFNSLLKATTPLQKKSLSLRVVLLTTHRGETGDFDLEDLIFDSASLFFHIKVLQIPTALTIPAVFLSYSGLCTLDTIKDTKCSDVKCSDQNSSHQDTLKALYPYKARIETERFISSEKS